MGSPNFLTSVDGLNLAYELDYGLEDPADIECDQEQCSYMQAQMAEVISDSPNLFFHRIELRPGYHNGFQIYIDPQFENREAYINGVVADWDKYGEFSDLYGYDTALADCPYFNKNAKNITPHSLSRAIDREYKTLHNLVLAKALEVGLGEVVGQTWTSSVQHPITAKLFKGY